MSNESENQSAPRGAIRLKKQVYKFRISECAEQTSQKEGNRMLVSTCEIVENPPVMVDGQEVDVNGIEITNYTTLTPKALFFVNQFQKALGLPELTDEDLPNVQASNYIDLKFYAIAEGKEVPVLDEEKKPIINPYTGKAATQTQRRIIQFMTP